MGLQVQEHRASNLSDVMSGSLFDLLEPALHDLSGVLRIIANRGEIFAETIPASCYLKSSFVIIAIVMIIGVGTGSFHQ